MSDGINKDESSLIYADRGIPAGVAYFILQEEGKFP